MTLANMSAVHRRLDSLQRRRKMRVLSVGFGLLFSTAIVAAQAPAAKPAAPNAPAAAGSTIRNQPVIGTLAQVMRGILFPNSNLVFDVQQNDPAAPKKKAAEGGRRRVVRLRQRVYRLAGRGERRRGARRGHGPHHEARTEVRERQARAAAERRLPEVRARVSATRRRRAWRPRRRRTRKR